MHHPTDRIAHTTAFVTPVVEHWLEREIAQWVHPMKDRSDDPSHVQVTDALAVVRASTRDAVGHGSIPRGGPIKLFLVPAIASQLVLLSYILLHNCCNKGCGMNCPDSGMMLLKSFTLFLSYTFTLSVFLFLSLTFFLLLSLALSLNLMLLLKYNP